MEFSSIIFNSITHQHHAEDSSSINDNCIRSTLNIIPVDDVIGAFKLLLLKNVESESFRKELCGK